MRYKFAGRTIIWKFIKLCIRIFLFIILIAGVSSVVLLKIGYNRASKHVSFLPSILPPKNPNETNIGSDPVNTAEIKGKWYTLTAGKNGKISVKSGLGEPIISSLDYYSSYEISGKKWGLDNESVILSNDTTISISGESQAGTKVNLTLTVPKNKPKIDISITTSYSKDVIVGRESLVAGFDIPVSEIYRKNRQVDTCRFDPEYWLLREGVRFGRGARSALVYHTPGVSSLQTDTRNRLLFINLDYCLDHPFFNIPYQKDGGGKWTDLSEAAYTTGEVRENSFSINIGDITESVPRIMLVPDGYIAGYVFTEHADGANIRTNRAAYFGSEDITRISDARGGFAGHKIPVTKSIFYPSIDVSLNSINKDDSIVQGQNFLDQLQSTGLYDICLHGANTDRKEAERWIKSMNERYGTKTWIDHGMFAGTSHRQSFVCDGLKPESQYYTADLWEKYNTRYFWNASVEELNKLPFKDKVYQLEFHEAAFDLWSRYFSAEELQKIGFRAGLKELFKRAAYKGDLNSFQPHRSSGLPTPLFWKHPTRTKNFYSWATDYVKFFRHTERGVRVEEENLNNLIADRGIFINHGYFVRNMHVDGVLTKSKGKLVTTPYFEKTLDIMARMRDKGDLDITTIRQLLDYWILIENVSFDYLPDRTIIINNLNDQGIRGFSLAVKAGNVKIDGKIPKCKRSGDDTIFWFDIGARQSVKLQTN